MTGDHLFGLGMPCRTRLPRLPLELLGTASSQPFLPMAPRIGGEDVGSSLPDWAPGIGIRNEAQVMNQFLRL